MLFLAILPLRIHSFNCPGILEYIIWSRNMTKKDYNLNIYQVHSPTTEGSQGQYIRKSHINEGFLSQIIKLLTFL